MTPPSTSPPDSPTLQKTYWQEYPVDIHLLPGKSSKSYLDILRALIDKKECKGGDGGAPNFFAPKIAAGFAPLVAAGDHGISVDAATGVVTVNDLPHGPWNFIVEVPFFEVTGLLDWKRLDAKFTRYFRVHVHRKVSQIAATPNPITVRIGDSARLRYLATFDDDSMGDITYANRDVNFTKGADCYAGWKGVKAGAVEAEVTFPDFVPSPGYKTKVTIQVEKSWRDLGASSTLELLIPRKDEAKPNPGWHILFLPEGWPHFLNGEFRRKAAKLARTIFETDAFTPLKLCKDSLTFWTCWLPSPPSAPGQNPSVTVFNEYIEFDSVLETDRVVPLPAPTPSGKPAKWVGPKRCVKSDLLFRVGLPVADDRARSPAELRERWLKLYGVPIDESKSFDLAFTVFKRRYLFAKADTVFETSFDSACSVEIARRDESSVDSFNLKLRNSDGLRDFLQALAENKWSADHKKMWTETNRQYKRGIAVLITATVVDIRADADQIAEVDLKVPIQYDGLDLDPPQFQADFSDIEIPEWQCTTFVHETAHGFGLGDEYEEKYHKDDPPDPAYIAQWPNVAYLAGKEIKEKSQKGFAKLGKWMDWHRIECACRILSGTSGDFPGEVKLDLNAGGVFKDADEIYIRTRPLATSQVFGPLTVLPPKDTDPNTTLRFVMVEDWQKNAEVFKNAIIYRPKTQLIKNKPVPLPLMAEVVRKEIIEERNSALNVPQGTTGVYHDANPISVCYPDFQVPGVTVFPSDIVGAYTGGAQYAADVYHPSSSCLMRNVSTIRPFCFVCQYALVDAIDPTKHGDLDRTYDVAYPTSVNRS